MSACRIVLENAQQIFEISAGWILGIGINIWVDTLGGTGIGPDDQNLHDRANSLIEDRFGSTIQTRV